MEAMAKNRERERQAIFYFDKTDEFVANLGGPCYMWSIMMPDIGKLFLRALYNNW